MKAKLESKIVNFPFVVTDLERQRLKKIALDRDWTVQKLLRTAVNQLVGKQVVAPDSVAARE